MKKKTIIILSVTITIVASLSYLYIKKKERDEVRERIERQTNEAKKIDNMLKQEKNF